MVFGWMFDGSFVSSYGVLDVYCGVFIGCCDVLMDV